LASTAGPDDDVVDVEFFSEVDHDLSGRQPAGRSVEADVLVADRSLSGARDDAIGQLPGVEGAQGERSGVAIVEIVRSGS